jgi:two-component system, cell cycle response regulator DivK
MPRILIVEDNEANREMISRRLQRRGYQTVISTDGSQAIAMAQSDTPDLILMDMGLPVIDGWEATRAIRRNPATSTLPIIAFTAHAMAGDREKTLQAGCDEYETKPVDFPRLVAKIGTLLASRRSRRDPEVVELSRFQASHDHLAGDTEKQNA